MYVIIEMTSKKTGETLRWIEKKDMPNTSIPFDPDNGDYRAYEKWVEEGNVAPVVIR